MSERSGSKLFTERWVKAVKPTSRQQEYFDAGFRLRGVSLGLRVSPGGAKSYFIKYRNVHRKQKVFTLGDASCMSVSEAHHEATTRKSEIDSGKDPAEKKQEYRIAETFGELTEQFLSYFKAQVASGERRNGTLRDYETAFRLYLSEWEAFRVRDITRAHVMRLLDHITVDRKAPVQAVRVRSQIHKMFSFAVERQIIDSNPCVGLPRLSKAAPRTHHLSMEEIRKVWRALADFPPSSRNVFKFLILTGQRAGEVTNLPWSEIHGDEWYLPAERCKSKRDHIIPLSRQAVRILDEMKIENAIAKDRSRKKGEHAKDYYDEFVFPSKREGKANIWLGKTCRRLIKVAKVEFFSPHDLRRTVATHLSRLQFSNEVISKVLNHKAQSVTSLHYVHHKALKEKREALDAWGKEVDSWVLGETIVELKQSA